MQKIASKRGLALGSIIAILLSTFMGVLPAKAADATEGAQIGIAPVAGPTSNLTGIVSQDFAIKAFLLPGASSADFGSGTVRWQITKTAGNLDVLVASQSGQATSIADAMLPGSNSGAVSSLAAVVYAAWTTGSVIAGNVASSKSILTVRAYTTSPGIVSSSPTVTLNIKFWIDNGAGTAGVHDSFEYYTEETVTLLSPNAVSATTTLETVTAGDTFVTVSSTVTGLNYQNISGVYFVQATSSLGVFVSSPSAIDDKVTESPDVSANQMVSRSGVVSHSWAVSGSSGVRSATSISAQVGLDEDDDGIIDWFLGAASVKVASNPSVGSLELDVVSGDHATQSGATATVRANQTYTFRVGAISNSLSVSNQAVSVKITGGPGLTLNVKHISINGGSATTSYPSTVAPLAVTTGTAGHVDFTVTPTGFVDGNDFTVTAYVGNNSKSLTVEVEGSSYSLTADYSQFKSGAGSTTTMTYQVKDQWGVHAPTSANLRLKMTKGGTGFSYTTTVSYVSVVDGRASFAFTPEAATKTGSATATAVMQELQPSSGAYLDISAGVAASVNVTATSDAFGTGLASSYSTSVSYFPSTVSWVTVTAKAANTGSAVVASGTGLIFRSNGVTYSDTVTVRAASNLNYTFEVAALTSGTYTLNLTTGTAATSSLIIVGGPSHNSGSAIVFDVTNIVPGRTAIVSGTVQDVNGNGVDTNEGAGTASILVTYTGTAGIPVGTMPTETDADGNFKVSILTSATDLGSFTLTAVYLKDGASTATADKVTKVHTITVGAAEASADQKITVGTFKGYVAIYTKGYMGQKLSAKVAGKWLVVDPIAAWQGNDYSRTVRLTGAGYTIKVDLYIDGVFVRSETVVTK